MRILRVFKLVRHFAGLQSLIHTMHQAYKELGLLLLLITVTILTGENGRRKTVLVLDSYYYCSFVFYTHLSCTCILVDNLNMLHDIGKASSSPDK